MGEEMTTILLAEAREDQAKAIVRIAKAGNCEVTVVTSYDSFKKLWGEQRFACLVVAFDLPDDGAKKIFGEVPNCARIGLLDSSEEIARWPGLLGSVHDVLFRNELGPNLFSRSVRLAVAKHAASSLRLKLNYADRLGAMGQLAAGVVHEVTNPAMFVSANNEIIASTLREYVALREALHEFARGDVPEAVGDAIKKMLLGTAGSHSPSDVLNMSHENIRGLQRIVRVVGKLRAFSRKGEGSLEEVNVNDVVGSACQMLSHELRQRAAVELDLSSILPEVVADRSEINQVITNLLLNASQAIESGQSHKHRIVVRTRPSQDGVAIEIADTGRGIPDEIIDRVFDPFFTTKSHEGGTGLGMSITRDIVDKYGGRIEILASSKDGTTVRVFLPRREGLLRGKAPSSVPRPAKRADPATERLRILVVDDEELILAAYSRLLRAHDLVLTGGSAEALEEIDKNDDFHGVLCDLMMPDLDGQEFYRQVQERAPELLSKIVFVTGGAFTSRMRDFVRSLETPVLQKPVSARDLRAIIDRWDEAEAPPQP